MADGAVTVLYGGVFDPIHDGHLHVASHVADFMGLKVHFVPSAVPPHDKNPAVTMDQRIEMIHLAVGADSRFLVEPIERTLAEPSWTVRTLEALKASKSREAPLVWVMGMDSAHSLPRWYKWQQLAELTNVLVVNRPGMNSQLSPEILEQFGGNILSAEDFRQRILVGKQMSGCMGLLEVTPHPASSSGLKSLLKEKVTEKWLAPPVAKYISDHNLYKIVNRS